MNINPEFRRNLWLELTPTRLVGMPLVLGVLLLLAYVLDDRLYAGGKVASTAMLLYGLLAILWGTKLASEALVTEIRDHTWDSQRMSVLGPWTMTWGKLLGSTVYPWYGALLCLAVYLTAEPEPTLSVPATLVLMVGSALFGQAVGLLASLQAIRKNQRYGRFQTTGFLVLGACCALLVLQWSYAVKDDVTWYGYEFGVEKFAMASVLSFLGWAVYGVYRLIRAELQLRSLPWAWVLFVLFMAVYFAGFPEALPWPGDVSLLPQRYLSGFLVVLALAYATAFFERKDPVAFRRLLRELDRRAYGRALEDAPLWLISLPLVAVACLLLVVADQGVVRVTVPAVAMTLFLLRDLGLLLLFNLGRVPKRADMLTVLYLVLLYGVVPAILAAAGLPGLAGLFWPTSDAAVLIPSALLQAMAVLALVAMRWRRRHARY